MLTVCTTVKLATALAICAQDVTLNFACFDGLGVNLYTLTLINKVTTDWHSSEHVNRVPDIHEMHDYANYD